MEFINYLRKVNRDTYAEVALGGEWIDIDVGLRNGKHILVELKCQTAIQTYHDIIKGFDDDRNKLNGHNEAEVICKNAIAFMYYDSSIPKSAYPDYASRYLLNDIQEKFYYNGNVYTNNLSQIMNPYYNDCKLYGITFARTCNYNGNNNLNHMKGVEALIWSQERI